MEFAHLCRIGWLASKQALDYEIKAWPLSPAGVARARYTAPPMSAFAEMGWRKGKGLNQLLATVADSNLVEWRIGRLAIEYDLSGIALLIGLEQFDAIPIPYRSSFVPLAVD